MLTKLIKISLFFMVWAICFHACDKGDKIEQQSDLVINLKWNKAYSNETQEYVEIGLKWALSFLGANLPVNAYPIVWLNNEVLQLDISKAGFSSGAQNAISQLITVLKSSEEYERNNAIDIGRFIMLTLNASNHYYKITEAKPSFLEYKNQFKYNDTLAAIIESSISVGQRKIALPKSNLVHEWSFTSAEGTGKIEDSTFIASEFEVLNIMPNGQLKFAIYNTTNNLMLSANNLLSTSGKPAKCLWCHESTIQTSFVGKTSVPGFYSIDAFKTIIAQQKTKLFSYQTSLASHLDFTKKQDHTFMELLYISFSEPSAERLALEWDLTVEKVKELMNGLPTHQHGEFPYLGTLYERKEADLRAPFKTIRVPDSAREMVGYEPNLIK